VHYRYLNTMYHIEVRQIPAGEKMTVTIDGVENEGNTISLTDDRAEHNILVAAKKNIKDATVSLSAAAS
jgi:hypothetical protein